MNTNTTFSSNSLPVQNLTRSTELGWNSMPSFTTAGATAPAELGWQSMGAWGSPLPESQADAVVASLAAHVSPVGERRLLASFWISMGVRSMQA